MDTKIKDIEHLFSDEKKSLKNKLNLECKKQQLFYIVQKLDQLASYREKQYSELYSSCKITNRVHELYSNNYILQNELSNAKELTLEIESALSQIKKQLDKIKPQNLI